MNNERENIKKKYDQSRGNLLLIIILTIINIALLFTSADTMFLFSITVPYWSAIFAYLFELTWFYVISGIILLVYLACWFFSKKHYGWFIPGLILFILDTIYLGYVTVDMGESSNIIDILIHIWALYYLGAGIYFGHKLKHLPKESNADTPSLTEMSEPADESSTPIRLAEDVKHRVFVEADYNNHHICYRHVKGANEFVVDGYVYGEYTKLIETAHSLSAKIDSLDISVGYDGAYHSYITVNGSEIARKVRII